MTAPFKAALLEEAKLRKILPVQVIEEAMALVSVGLGLVGAAAHASIMASGGYTSHSAIMTLAIAFGVSAGAVALGVAAGERRGLLAVFMFVSLLCAESFNVVSSFERVIASREHQAAPLRAALAAHESAKHRVAAAEKALSSVPTTSDRLRNAEPPK